jgi:hypothetical protein
MSDLNRESVMRHMTPPRPVKVSCQRTKLAQYTRRNRRLGYPTPQPMGAMDPLLCGGPICWFDRALHPHPHVQCVSP